MKTANKFVLIFAIIMLVINFVYVSGVNAGALWDLQIEKGGMEGVGAAFGQSDANPVSFQITIALLIRVFLSFLGIIFLVLMLWAGFKWMTSQGNETKVEESKKMILAATVGLIIILMSYGVTQFVSSCFYDISTGGDGVWSCAFN